MLAGGGSRPVRRRAVLSAGLLAPLLAPLTGCTRGGPAPDPDAALRTAAVTRERELLSAYDTVLAGLPAVGRADLLRALRAEHEQHLAVLGEPVPPGPGSPSSSSPLPASGAPVDLVAAETAAAAAHTRAALAAGSRRLAAVLASLAASEASHPVALA